MMTTKQTAGKWRVSNHGDGQILDASGNPINGNQREQLVREHNCHDELLAALEVAEIALSHTECSGEKALSNGQALDIARAAIARAKDEA